MLAAGVCISRLPIGLVFLLVLCHMAISCNTIRQIQTTQSKSLTTSHKLFYSLALKISLIASLLVKVMIAFSCIMLTEPLRADAKTTESWNTVLCRLRQLVLDAYNCNIDRFEEHMRAERERRIEARWSFCAYFLLQVQSFVILLNLLFAS